MARTLKEHGPHPVDIHVGKRLKLRRRMLGLSQTDMGDALSLSFQQVQKYERGGNRIGASRLWELSEILDVPVTYFFDDLPRETNSSGTIGVDTFQDPIALEVVRAFTAITDTDIRRRFAALARSLAPKLAD